ncbi:hypothetical protein M0802_011790 [Mischocyttarus mexicanus]|nr:hypothetical protein M0802_011790 [Mischocyttarus mexicanus]
MITVKFLNGTFRDKILMIPGQLIRPLPIPKFLNGTLRDKILMIPGQIIRPIAILQNKIICEMILFLLYVDKCIRSRIES